MYRKNDYKKLEIHHGYVQWLFPNFYGSAYNRDSHKLLLEEAKIFRENKEVFYDLYLKIINFRLPRDLLGLMK